MKQHLGPAVEDRKYGKCYRLAIKRLSGSRLRTYNQERRAFKGIRDKQGMLRCLGFYSFTDNEHDEDEHYNILLEYAELNLHEFFKDFHPPQLAKDIYSQWKDFCRIAEAIETLHGFDFDETRWSGWHGDIKPKNLLLVNGEWKIADYGFAVFRPRASDDSPTTQLEECTQTWGAPETVRSGNHVLQTVDTWSFGCVLSIAATWMVKGNKGVLEYQEYRSQIAKKVRHEDHPPDAFHDGMDVLPHIRVWHAHLKQLMQKELQEFIEARSRKQISLDKSSDLNGDDATISLSHPQTSSSLDRVSPARHPESPTGYTQSDFQDPTPPTRDTLQERFDATTHRYKLPSTRNNLVYRNEWDCSDSVGTARTDHEQSDQLKTKPFPFIVPRSTVARSASE
ncbi:hypothetical protein KCU77_g2024, partial [Aureobasidium melanogenum]